MAGSAVSCCLLLAAAPAQALTDSVLLKISHTGKNFRSYTVHVGGAGQGGVGRGGVGYGGVGRGGGAGLLSRPGPSGSRGLLLLSLLRPELCGRLVCNSLSSRVHFPQHSALEWQENKCTREPGLAAQPCPQRPQLAHKAPWPALERPPRPPPLRRYPHPRLLQDDGSSVTVQPGLIGGEVNRILAAHQAKHKHPVQVGGWAGLRAGAREGT